MVAGQTGCCPGDALGRGCGWWKRHGAAPTEGHHLVENKIRLNDLQLMLLSHAAKDDTGSLLPLPHAGFAAEERTSRELKSLLQRKLIEEIQVAERARSCRDEDERLFGLRLTDAAREALGLEPDAAIGTTAASVRAAAAGSANPRSGSKIGQVITLLEREGGATMEEMVEVTGWLPHATRAALTRLKNRSYSIERGSLTCYRIAASA
jgi:hypothetical protein